MSAPRTNVLLAFAALYLFWGSTYLFIKYTVESFPPLGMAGARFLLAGAILYGFGRLRGAARPGRREWGAALIVGVLLMSSNAAVAWSETRIPSGVASLLVAMTPCWMVLFDWLGWRGARPGGGVILGLIAGLAGIAILIGPGSLLGGAHIERWGAAAVLVGTVAWSVGSLYARSAPRPASPAMLSGMQMLCGGAVLSIIALSTGQWRTFSLAAATPRAIWSFVYLITFGSLVAYSAYMYLLTVSTPARVSTYAFVNPVVAVLLGWAFAGESLSPRVLVASAIIVGAVALIVSRGASPGASPPRRTARAANELSVTTESA